jgi:hypothetical protein
MVILFDTGIFASGGSDAGGGKVREGSTLH